MENPKTALENSSVSPQLTDEDIIEKLHRLYQFQEKHGSKVLFELFLVCKIENGKISTRNAETLKTLRLVDNSSEKPRNDVRTIVLSVCKEDRVGHIMFIHPEDL